MILKLIKDTFLIGYEQCTNDMFSKKNLELHHLKTTQFINHIIHG